MVSCGIQGQRDVEQHTYLICLVITHLDWALLLQHLATYIYTSINLDTPAVPIPSGILTRGGHKELEASTLKTMCKKFGGSAKVGIPVQYMSTMEMWLVTMSDYHIIILCLFCSMRCFMLCLQGHTAAPSLPCLHVCIVLKCGTLVPTLHMYNDSPPLVS
jgi:hypothetical protein